MSTAPTCAARCGASPTRPIIVLTARGDELDRVLLLELGADDYVVKPFGFRELVARIRAVRRRVDTGEPTTSRTRASQQTSAAAHRSPHAVASSSTTTEVTLTPEGVRPARRSSPKTRARSCGASDSSRRSGTSTGGGRRRPSTCTSRRCARSSASPASIATVRGVGYRLDVGRDDPPARHHVPRVTAFALALFAIPLGITFAHHEQRPLLSEIEADADAMAARVEDPLEQAPARADAPTSAATRRGRAATSSWSTPRRRAPRHRVPRRAAARLREPARDLQCAARARASKARRSSDTARTTLLYAAVPTTANGQVNGAVRITYPTRDARRPRAPRCGRSSRCCASACSPPSRSRRLLARAQHHAPAAPARARDRPLRAPATSLARVDDRSGLAGAAPSRRDVQPHGRPRSHGCSTRSSASSPTRRTSCARRSPRCACASRTSTRTSTTRSRARSTPPAHEVARMSRLVDGLLVLAHDERRTQRVVRRRRRRESRANGPTCGTTSSAERDVALVARRARRGVGARRRRARSNSSSTTSSTTRSGRRRRNRHRASASQRRTAGGRAARDRRGPGSTPTRGHAPSTASGARPTRRPAAPVSGSRSSASSPRRRAAAPGSTPAPGGGLDAVVVPRPRPGRPRTCGRDVDLPLNPGTDPGR